MLRPLCVTHRRVQHAATIVIGLALITRTSIGFAQTVNPPPSTPGPQNTTPSAQSGSGSASEPMQQEPAQGILPEPGTLTRAVDFISAKFSSGNPPTNGFYPKFGTHMPGAGWIALGPGYAHPLWQDTVEFNVAGAVSWRRYMFGEGRLELPHLANDHLMIGAQVLTEDWTQVVYYGTGPQSLLSNASEYRLRDTDDAVYVSVRAGRSVDLRVRGGLLQRAEVSTATGWHDRGFAHTQDLFSSATTPGLDVQPRFSHVDASITINTLDYPGHPTHGSLWQLSASSFHDRDFGRSSFRRYELIGIQCVPIVANRWTIAARGTVMGADTSNGNQVPFYLLPSLGGQNLLRGFADDRFHDRSLFAINLESRWALLKHVDAAVFTDFGEVAPHLSAISRANLLSDVGAGVRLHTGRATLVRLDLSHSIEGWRFLFKTSDSFSFSTLRRWTTVLPLIP